jgi:uncharacterized membrane protein
MTDSTSDATIGNEFDADAQFEIERRNTLRTHTIICYVLMLLSFVTGISGLIGLIWAYVKRGDAHKTRYYDHFSNVINVFWVSLLLGLVGLFTTIFVVGYFIILGNVVWVLYRMIKGLIRTMDRKPYFA